MSRLGTLMPTFDRLPGLAQYPDGLAVLGCATCRETAGWYTTTATADRIGWRLLRTACGAYAVCPDCVAAATGAVRVVEDDGECD